jgi:hypothetical protein
MKTKNLSPKLSLNKKTIANLNNKEMKNLIGGYPATFGPNSCEFNVCHTQFYPSCHTWWYRCGCEPIETVGC